MLSVEEFERLAGVEIERMEGEAMPPVQGVKGPCTYKGVEIKWTPFLEGTSDSEVKPE